MAASSFLSKSSLPAEASVEGAGVDADVVLLDGDLLRDDGVRVESGEVNCTEMPSMGLGTSAADALLASLIAMGVSPAASCRACSRLVRELRGLEVGFEVKSRSRPALAARAATVWYAVG